MPSLLLRLPKPKWQFRRPSITWPISFSLWQLEQVVLFILPLTGFLGMQVLPTWRIMNILYVVIGLYNLKLGPDQRVLKNLLYLQLGFLLAVALQYTNKDLSYPWSFYDISWCISILVLFALGHLFFLSVQKRLQEILQVFEWVAVANIAYQLYQQVMFQLHQYHAATILNEANITHGNVFFKLVGPLLGSPGFMAESGHLALFLAPLIGFQLVADYYDILPLNKRRVQIMGASLALTLSSGAFLQFGFLALLQVLIIRKNLSRRSVLNMVALFIGIVLVFSTFRQYREAILYRFDSVFEQDSGRFMGAKVFWEIFQENFWFGIGPKSARFSGADPNFLPTSVLADHGIVGGLAFILLYFVPVILAAWYSQRKMFLIPFVAMTVHLFLAYGTFTWSFIWMHLALTIWGLAYAQPTFKTQPALAQS